MLRKKRIIAIVLAAASILTMGVLASSAADEEFDDASAESVEADVLHITYDGELNVIGSESGITYDGYQVKRSHFESIFFFHREKLDVPEFADEDAAPGRGWWYKVRGYADIDGKKCCSPWSEAVKIEY